MESVTLVGMRPRAVGNPIENLCSVIGAGAEGDLDSNRLPALVAVAGVSSSGKLAVSTTAAAGDDTQPLYDEQTLIDKHPKHIDYEHNDIMGQNAIIKPAPTRLPAIQSAGGSKTDLSGVAIKRSATSGTVPMSPETAMKLYMHKLSAYEQHEIFDYPKVCLVCFTREHNIADVMGVSLQASVPTSENKEKNINNNSNNLTNNHEYNFDSQFLIILIHNYI